MVVLSPDLRIRTIVGSNNVAYQILVKSVDKNKATFKVVKVN